MPLQFKSFVQGTVRLWAHYVKRELKNWKDQWPFSNGNPSKKSSGSSCYLRLSFCTEHFEDKISLHSRHNCHHHYILNTLFVIRIIITSFCYAYTIAIAIINLNTLSNVLLNCLWHKVLWKSRSSEHSDALNIQRLWTSRGGSRRRAPGVELALGGRAATRTERWGRHVGLCRRPPRRRTVAARRILRWGAPVANGRRHEEGTNKGHRGGPAAKGRSCGEVLAARRRGGGPAVGAEAIRLVFPCGRWAGGFDAGQGRGVGGAIGLDGRCNRIRCRGLSTKLRLLWLMVGGLSAKLIHLCT